MADPSIMACLALTVVPVAAVFWGTHDDDDMDQHGRRKQKQELTPGEAALGAYWCGTGGGGGGGACGDGGMFLQCPNLASCTSPGVNAVWSNDDNDSDDGIVVGVRDDGNSSNGQTRCTDGGSR